MTAVAVVGTRLTADQAEEAAARGEIEKPRHGRWNEELQRFVGMGEGLSMERAEREADPKWQLEQYQKMRGALQEFVGTQLKECEYDPKGYPLEGKVNDYYRVPGSSKKALTKLGAEKLCNLFRWQRASSRTAHLVQTPEYVSATVNCELRDKYGHPVGSHEAAASTAEAGFRSVGARRKYGAKVSKDGKETSPPDFRAALNDVVARAGKRAFVGAVIVAAAADEIFEIATELNERKDEDDPRVKASKLPSDRTRVNQGKRQEKAPEKPKSVEWDGDALKAIRGKPLAMHTTAELEQMLKALRSNDPSKFAQLIDALSQEIAARVDEPLAEASDEEDDLPF